MAAQQPAKKTNLLVILAAVLAISVTATLGVYFSYSFSQGEITFTVPDISSAANSCEDYITDNYGKSLMHKSYDHGSSSYDEIRKRYTVWFRITTRDTDDEGRAEIKDGMVKCEINEFLGYVSSFEAYDL